MEDFYSSEAGKFITIAKSFLEGAKVLSKAQREKGRILFLPTLALAGHGLETMLKACLLHNGQTPSTKGRQGHDVKALWNNDFCEPVRGHVYVNAVIAAEINSLSGEYLDTLNDNDNLTLIEEYVMALAELHGEQGYPLRYPTDSDRMAPTTPFLVEALWRTADDFIRQPCDFEISHFRNLR